MVWGITLLVTQISRTIRALPELIYPGDSWFSWNAMGLRSSIDRRPVPPRARGTLPLHFPQQWRGIACRTRSRVPVPTRPAKRSLMACHSGQARYREAPVRQRGRAPAMGDGAAKPESLPARTRKRYFCPDRSRVSTKRREPAGTLPTTRQRREPGSRRSIQ